MIPVSASSFKNGRQFATYLGIVPKQHSSGGKEKLLGISKRGDGYLRGLLIHGARAVINQLDKQKNERFKWVKTIIERREHNKACVALANKNARIIWALLNKGCEYRNGSDLRVATA
ncbi:MAG: IS110 family transposase [Oligoflexia bacterium]|nr:IS110 family transposase [Oligoflexia bacterium]